MLPTNVGEGARYLRVTNKQKLLATRSIDRKSPEATKATRMKKPAAAQIRQ